MGEPGLIARCVDVADVIVARSAMVNGLPGMIFEGRAGVIQTVALEIEDDLVRTIYVVRNPDKLKHLARA